MSLPSKMKEKLQGLPSKPGVYIMRDRQGKIVYVGKAASLRSRVQSYFRKATLKSGTPKLRSLIHSIADFEYVVTRTEAEATLTEGKLIKEYRPRYNVSFRDDKRFLLLRVHLKDPVPRFDAVRIRKDDGATYFGPYASTEAARATLEFLDKRFGLRRCQPSEPGPLDHKHCLNEIVRYCSAPCINKVTRKEYLERVTLAVAFLRGEKPEYLREMQEAMEAAAKELDFEKAAALRDTLLLLRKTVKERAFIRKTPVMKEEEAREGTAELKKALGLKKRPGVIEAYDISNISGTHAVGSLVCAVDGTPNRNRYRMFRIRTVEGIDDPKMIAEVIRRRFKRAVEEKTSLPDLVIIDGGITQLRAAREEMDQLGLDQLPAAGLAKRFEELHWIPRGSTTRSTSIIRFRPSSPALRVLQQIRDEAHRFALTYHRNLRTKRIRESILDEIEGIGEKRKQVLLQHFGSLRRMRKASAEEIAAVPGIGPVMAKTIHEKLAASED